MPWRIDVEAWFACSCWCRWSKYACSPHAYALTNISCVDDTRLPFPCLLTRPAHEGCLLLYLAVPYCILHALFLAGQGGVLCILVLAMS